MTEFVCLVCGRSLPHGDLQTCPSCGPAGILDVRYDYDAAARTLTRDALVARPANHWRYRELLPIRPDVVVPPLHVGWTPVHEAPRLAAWAGVARLFLKDDGRNPTASFKDRASSLGVLKALEFGYDTIACASTGNAASSLAGLAASVGLRAMIFVPARAPEPKVTQLLVFGATVFRVKGTYEDAFDLCRASCERFHWYNRNSGTNPFLVEGKKTVAFEVCEQLGFRAPDRVFVPVGDGCIMSGTYKGFAEFARLGFTEKVPTLVGVQAEGLSPVKSAFERGCEMEPCRGRTCADSIAVGHPRNWRKALKGVRASGGLMMSVSDDEILAAIPELARATGVFG